MCRLLNLPYWRHFAWNVNAYFLKKKKERKTNIICVSSAEFAPFGDNLYEVSKPIFWEQI